VTSLQLHVCERRGINTDRGETSLCEGDSLGSALHHGSGCHLRYPHRVVGKISEGALSVSGHHHLVYIQ